jgi:hypothetical protein
LPYELTHSLKRETQLLVVLLCGHTKDDRGHGTQEEDVDLLSDGQWRRHFVFVQLVNQQ